MLISYGYELDELKYHHFLRDVLVDLDYLHRPLPDRTFNQMIELVRNIADHFGFSPLLLLQKYINAREIKGIFLVGLSKDRILAMLSFESTRFLNPRSIQFTAITECMNYFLSDTDFQITRADWEAAVLKMKCRLLRERLLELSPSK